jgi:bacteriocin resistance YdeI/OmpD-like protein
MTASVSPVFDYDSSLVSAGAPMPIELGRLLLETAVARRGWTTLTTREREEMIEYVSTAREPHVRERRAALVFMSLAGLAPRRT